MIIRNLKKKLIKSKYKKKSLSLALEQLYLSKAQEWLLNLVRNDIKIKI